MMKKRETKKQQVVNGQIRFGKEGGGSEKVHGEDTRYGRMGVKQRIHPSTHNQVRTPALVHFSPLSLYYTKKIGC